MLEVKVSQRGGRQQSAQTRLRRSRRETRVIFGRENDHRVSTVHRHTLRPPFPSVSHDLAEMSLGILKLPCRKRATDG